MYLHYYHHVYVLTSKNDDNDEKESPEKMICVGLSVDVVEKKIGQI